MRETSESPYQRAPRPIVRLSESAAAAAPDSGRSGSSSWRRRSWESNSYREKSAAHEVPRCFITVCADIRRYANILLYLYPLRMDFRTRTPYSHMCALNKKYTTRRLKSRMRLRSRGLPTPGIGNSPLPILQSNKSTSQFTHPKWHNLHRSVYIVGVGIFD